MIIMKIYYFLEKDKASFLKRNSYIFLNYSYNRARFLWRYINKTTKKELPDLQLAFCLREKEKTISLRCNCPENSSDKNKLNDIRHVYSNYGFQMKASGALLEFDMCLILNEINVLDKKIEVFRDEKTHHSFLFLEDNYLNKVKKNEILTILRSHVVTYELS